MQKILEELEKDILTVCDILKSVSENSASQSPAPGKWSVKEILGHLIDSAFNNQCRFILMHSRDSLLFESYDQEKWVELNVYRNRIFEDIIRSWKVINLHILYTLKNFDDTFWNKKFTSHSLNKSYWKAISINEIATPAHFVKDYFAHMRHHLKQISRIINLDFSFGEILYK
jgi:hypothetical protein